jgi:cytochrome c-type biogenesis protein CcmE
MRKILVLCVAVLVIGVMALVWLFTRPEHHGRPFEGAPKASIQELTEKPGDFLDKDITVEGEVVRQCPASGCWLFVKDDSGREIRIEMGGVTPTLPQRKGKTAVVEGRLSKAGESYEIDGKGITFR